jgi:hypothetical protein
MEETKFQVWDKEKETLLYYNGSFFVSKDKRKFVGTEIVFNNVQYVMLQYTGLKDKNNKEIYRSYILAIEDYWKEAILDDGSGPNEPFNHLCEVVFREGCFGVEIKENGKILYEGFYTLKQIFDEVGQERVGIVGTSFENPELLEWEINGYK